MPLTLKDALAVLPASRLPKKELNAQELKVLTKKFKAKSAEEPKNTGVEKEVGPRMIRAVAQAAKVAKK